MMTKMIFKGIRGLQLIKATPLAFLLLNGNTGWAQTNAQSGASEFPYLEVFGSIGVIVLLILIAWFMVSKQSKPEIKADRSEMGANSRRHFDHPNDPHFKKLRRNTS